MMQMKKKSLLVKDLSIFQGMLDINISGIPFVWVPDYFPVFSLFF